MESHHSGWTAPEADQPKNARALDERYNKIRFLSRHCNAPASAFDSQPEWLDLAKRAFAEWADHVEMLLPGNGGAWFAAAPSGAWAEFHSQTDGLEEDSLAAGKQLVLETVSRFQAAELTYLEQVSQEGATVLAAPLYAYDGAVAMVLGLVALGTSLKAPAGGSELFNLAAGYPAFLYYQIEKNKAARLSERQRQHEKEARRKELLFEMAHELYSKIDTDEILAEIIKRICQFYPDARIDLLMTQDQPSSKLPVKPLKFVGGEEDSCARAFMEGRIVSNPGDREGEFEMAVPISGKQGIYGVLHVHSHKGRFGSSDMQIMDVLAGAAGSAFENAKLYEQSNILVNELRLINELTKQLNQSLKLNDTFEFACAELREIFHADFCSILQLDPETRQLSVQATNVPEMAGEVYDEHSGYAGIVCQSKEPVIVSDYWADHKVVSRMMQVTGARSLIAAPLVVHNESNGIVLVAQRVPGFFTYDNYKLLQVLAGHVGLALTNASLHAAVRRMVITDNLTGLYARHYLDEQVGFHQKKDLCGSLIVVDIDHFKQVNDTYGHQVGDKILMQVSRIIKSSIRETDIAARWGGEELAIYLPQVMTEQAVSIAERIREKVEKDTDPSTTVSCGISQWNCQDEKISVESLFYRSDMALYRAKHEGRNRIKVG